MRLSEDGGTMRGVKMPALRLVAKQRKQQSSKEGIFDQGPAVLGLSFVHVHTFFVSLRLSHGGEGRWENPQTTVQ
jgi:hypothetical protein